MKQYFGKRMYVPEKEDAVVFDRTTMNF